MNTPLYSTLFGIRQKLLESRGLLVLGESCTSGLAAAELGKIPGVSEVFCGSQVVYQTETKREWLGISEEGLADPHRGPVSQWASDQLAEALLLHTPRATIAAAVTGHLGPKAPQHLDGTVYFAILTRGGVPAQRSILLESPPPADSLDWSSRAARQRESAERFLRWIEEYLSAQRAAS